MSTTPRTSAPPITGSAPFFNSHTPERRVQPRSALSLQLSQWWELPGLRVFHLLARTPSHWSPSPIGRMTSPELSQGAQGPRSSLPLAPERGVPCRRLEVMKTSTPGLGANSPVTPLTGAARTCFSSLPWHRRDWPSARDLQGPPKGAGVTTLRRFHSILELSHFKSHSGLWWS